MSEYTQAITDLKSLIGEQIYTGYLQQEQDREVIEANEYEPLTCYFCKAEIKPDEALNPIIHTIAVKAARTLSQPTKDAMSSFIVEKVTFALGANVVLKPVDGHSI